MTLHTAWSEGIHSQAIREWPVPTDLQSNRLMTCEHPTHGIGSVAGTVYVVARGENCTVSAVDFYVCDEHAPEFEEVLYHNRRQGSRLLQLTMYRVGEADPFVNYDLGASYSPKRLG